MARNKTPNSGKGAAQSKSARSSKQGPRTKRKTGRGAKLSPEASERRPYDSSRRKRVPVHVRMRTLDYEHDLGLLHIELLKWQNHVKATGEQVVMLFEGRDAAGKGGTIQRIMAPLNPRGARVVALEKPSDRERTQWYFQRYVTHLPAAGEIVFFDRSWYNRAMVEPVMGFCTDEEHKRFMKDVPPFEELLVKSKIKLFKFYFSVSREEQARRFESRTTDVLKRFKISAVDKQAQDLWDAYTVKKFQMLTETNRSVSPWWIIRSDDKKAARLGCIKRILSSVEYEGKSTDATLFEIDPSVVVNGIDELKYLEESLLADRSV
jgi:polyphosphate kinase 2